MLRCRQVPLNDVTITLFCVWSYTTPYWYGCMTSQLRHCLAGYIGQTWQAGRDEYPANKLHSIFPSVKDAKPKYLTNRNDQIVFTRCCIGYSRLTNDYHLKGEPPPECIVCNCTLTVKHLSLNCINFDALRQQFYKVANLPELFKSVSPEKIVGFLKAAGLFNRF